MSDFLSLSVLQLLSVLSFLTSVLAVLRVGSGSLHRLAHKFDSDVTRSPADMPSVGVAKHASWSWSFNGLPVSFSLNTLIGDDEQGREATNELGGYSGGAQLVRMNWQASKTRNVPPIQYSQGPASMAKLLMSRHSQRKPYRIPRRMPGMPRPTPPSKLMESAV